MITPGFFGFFNAHRALVVAQNALSTVNHNIANANTEGYTRQRVEISAFPAYAFPSPNNLNSGQIGQGPTLDAVVRLRDNFLDAQYRLENSVMGMNEEMRNVLQQIEGILAEPSTGGVNAAMQKFFDAAQELSLHPDSLAVRADFVQQAIDLVSVFQQQAGQLADLRRTLTGSSLVPGSEQNSQLAIQARRVNEILSSIAGINKNIVSVQASGARPNDLYDQRDVLLDQLSELVDVDVTLYDSGQIDLSIGGVQFIRGTDQVERLEVVANPDPLTNYDRPALLRTVTGGVVLNDGAGPEITSGRIKGLIDMSGYPSGVTSVRSVIDDLNTLIDTLATEVNQLQQAGRDGYLNPNPPANPDIFVLDPALNPGEPLNLYHYRVNAVIINDPRRVAAAVNDASAATGDGRNALAMAQLRDQPLIGGGTFVDFFNGLVSNTGIDTRSYEDRTSAQGRLVHAIEQRRQSVSGVNVDEEMIDMLRFQRAFEASSRVIRTLDEILQNVLNMV